MQIPEQSACPNMCQALQNSTPARGVKTLTTRMIFSMLNGLPRYTSPSHACEFWRQRE